MERFREKCVFRGLLFYWYKVSIFNHTQSMRVINYIILKLNHGRDLFSTFTWCYLICVPYFILILFFSLWMKSSVLLPFK